MRRSYIWPLVLFVCALPLMAGDFWTTKKFPDWTDKEVVKMLADSPWAAVISSGGAANLQPPDMNASRGGRGSRNSGGSSMGDASGGGELGGGMNGQGEGGSGRGTGGGGGRAMSLTLQWATAAPIKQALIRRGLGAEAAKSEQAAKALAAPDTFYVIRLVGFRPPRTPDGKSDITSETVMAATALNRKGKPPLKPEKVGTNRDEKDGVVHLFLFSRKDAITLEDKEVEFVTKLGQTEIKHKFKLKDMMFEGNLAL